MLSCWQSAEGEKPSLRLLMEHAITQLVSGSLFYWEVQGVIVQDFEGIHVMDVVSSYMYPTECIELCVIRNLLFVYRRERLPWCARVITTLVRWWLRGELMAM